MDLKKIRKIIIKVILGFGFIAALFFIALNVTQKKSSQLTENVSAILEPNIKLLKLKEISDCIYNAEANVKAYVICHDTTFLYNYKNNINFLNSRLDTLLYMSSEGKITSIEDVKSKDIFSGQIDTLSELISLRLDLFKEYIELKTGKNSQDILLQLLQDIKIKRATPIENNKQNSGKKEKSFFSQLFSTGDNKNKISASDQENILEIITQVQHEEKTNNRLLAQEIHIAQREYILTNRILFLLKSMEEKELVETRNKIKLATKETTAQINSFSNWFTVIGLVLSLLFSYFIYTDILRSRRFREQLLKAKIDFEKSASQYSLSLIEASLDPLLTINSEGKITDMNEATINITGVSREILTGSDFFNYFTKPQKAREVYQNVFAKGSVADSPLTLCHKDGHLTDVLFNGSVYKNESGIVQGVVVVARDITKQTIFENELIESKSKAESATKRAEESNRLIEAFLANMSHEIRTPLNAVMGFSGLLSKKKLGEKEKKYVAAIKTAGENLLVIINDILDISKIEAGMMTFESVAFSVKETMKSLKVLLLDRAKEKNIELSFSCDENVPDVLLGDHTRLTQIIINLVDNAIKFTKEGSVHVHASVQNKKDDQIMLAFSVTDTGIGISQDKLEQIFDRFTQAESHTTRLYGGTGLGLSISKKLAELQGGILSVKSELNKGSVFSFSIPYKKTSQTQIKPENVEMNYNMEDLSKLKILLVEDSKLNVQLILSLFSENNLQAQVAENGSICIEKLKKNNGSTSRTSIFDIILMDMEMPVMTGYEAATVIRTELKNNIPIIAMTAHAMAGERERCLRLGMNDYISKPINTILLFEKMYELTKKN
ncbi:MAG: ATP-binding protein [Bacteroidota bacterium]